MTLRRERIAAWLSVAVIGFGLTVITLGHLGPSTVTEKFRLIPGENFTQPLHCIVARCPGWRSSLQLLFIDGLGNIAVFVPLGAVLAWALIKTPIPGLLATFGGGLLSFGFEFTQIWIPGRVVATDDVILNTLGAALGALLLVSAVRMGRWLRRRRHRADGQ